MNKSIIFLYKNWQGVVAERHVEPIEIWFGSTEWHKERQWFIKALDLEKHAERDFALKDILEWR